MPKKQSEIFETISADEPVETTEEPPKKTTIKQKREITEERLKQLKEQLERGRATRLAKREQNKNEKVKPTNPEKKQEEDKRPIANQVWGEQIAELKNEIKSLKSRFDKPIDDVVVIKTSKVETPKPAPAVKAPAPVAPVKVPAQPAPVKAPAQPAVVKPPASAPISIPKPKQNIYSAFKVANW
jgi:hypothetical protein